MNRYMFVPDRRECDADTTRSNSILYVARRIIDYVQSKGHEVVSSIKDADRLVVHAAKHPYYDEYGVMHIHGLYPTSTGKSWNEGHMRINKSLATAAQHSTATIVPSLWVQRTFAREVGIDAHVIGWGIDIDDWQYKPNKDSFVLWNKTRSNDICNPYPIEYLAEHLPKHKYVSTFADHRRVQRIGAMTRPRMAQVTHDCAVYLATTLETFGLATVEAMACGKPVLGFKWGGTADIVRHGVDGYLANSGDFRDLAIGLEYVMDNYDQLAANARRRAEQYTWDKCVQMLYSIYEDTSQREYDYDVSVIIPSYNYDQYLGRCIESVYNQVNAPRYEIIVIDDNSDDNSLEIARGYAHLHNFRLLVNSENIGTANSRNKAIEQARSKYILCLDADDYIQPTLLRILYEECRFDTTTIAYSGIRVERADGVEIEDSWTIREFDYSKLHINQIPTCCMYSKRMWDISGGYDGRHTPAEDAGLWSTMVMKGAKPKLVTQDKLFIHVRHGENQSKNKEAGSWNRQHASILSPNSPHPIGSSVPDAVHMFAHSTPYVTVLVMGLHPNILDTLDSIHAQSYRWWHCVLMTTGDYDLHRHRYAWVEQHQYTGNPYVEGLQYVEGEYTLIVHARDILHPTAIERLIRTVQQTGKFAYSDYSLQGGESVVTDDYNRDRWNAGSLIDASPIALIPTEWLKRTPYTNMSDMYINLSRTGLCGHRIPEVLYSTVRTMPPIAPHNLIQEIAPMCCGYTPKSALKKKAVPSPKQELLFTGAVLSTPVYGTVTKQYYGMFSRGDRITLDEKDIKAMKKTGLVK